ncbi:zinc finger protein 501-like [Heteronotia binoei]|uniref:zinc finger protein 501-like n=1 Tax=Heteronotia binoei TaxID=13085 RepID=UPI0029304BBB|nr:zinc finger protein 501-like [Heteronotia binoei]
MVDEEDGKGAGTVLRIPVGHKRGRKKKHPTGTEKLVTRRTDAPIKREARPLPPRVSLKMNPPKCPECGKSFLSNVAMTIHIRTHTGERPFKCHLCAKAFASRGDLKRHLRRHLHQKPPPPTGESPPASGKKSLAAELQLLDHLQLPRGPQKPHACPQCGKSFDTKQSLRKHEGTHSAERPFPCPECGSRFRLKQILAAHMNSHVQERPFACPQCERRFSQERNMRLHQQRVHLGEKPFVCVACGKCFGYKQPLLKHLRLHTGERPFACAECGKAFRDRATLVIHNRMHTGERPYHCPFCGKNCRQKQHLNSHLRVHRGEKLPSEGLALQEKPHPCPACGKRFKDRKIMLAHQKTHEEEEQLLPGGDPLPGGGGPSQGGAESVSRKPHPGATSTLLGAKAPMVCPDCGRSFTQQKYLTLHQRSHR